MRITKTNVKKIVFVTGRAGNYQLQIDSSMPEAASGRLEAFGGCVFSGEILIGDYRTAMAMQRLIRTALIGLELPN